MHIVAHRGSSARFPELTAPAFHHALELPIHGVETDVRLTHDGTLVCIHDPVVNRVSNGRGRVSAMDVDQLKKLNVGTAEQPQKVLTFDELLDIMEDYPEHHLYVETKHPVRYAGMAEEEMVRRLRYRSLLDDPRFHLISFSLPAIRKIRNLAPDMDRFHLRRAWEQKLNRMDVRMGHPTGLGLSFQRAKLKPSLIGRKSLPTYMWTVDHPADMVWARKHGVSVLATNVPDIAVQVLGQEKASTTENPQSSGMYADSHGQKEEEH